LAKHLYSGHFFIVSIPVPEEVGEEALCHSINVLGERRSRGIISCLRYGTQPDIINGIYSEQESPLESSMGGNETKKCFLQQELTSREE